MDFGGTSRPRGGAKVDVESLERENDRGVDVLGDRVGLLKSLTQGIKNEVDSQHSVLDNMGESMFNVRGMLGGVNEKFQKVLADKSNHKTIAAVVGSAVVLFFLWYYTRK
ncbi:hypothetical protein FOA52_015611 [Chlamydomonas sp. UWO 241]|nr:hypothetical protein FOA52_015611 [Chlamydomonas sp. UWO 241]